MRSFILEISYFVLFCRVRLDLYGSTFFTSTFSLTLTLTFKYQSMLNIENEDRHKEYFKTLNDEEILPKII